MIRSSLESKLYILYQGINCDPSITAPQPPGPKPSRSTRSYFWLSSASAAGSLCDLLAYRTAGRHFPLGFVPGHPRARGLALAGRLYLPDPAEQCRPRPALASDAAAARAQRRASGGLTSDTAIGFTAVVLLGRVGEVVRPYLIAVQTGVPFSSQVPPGCWSACSICWWFCCFSAIALTRIPPHSWRLGPRFTDAWQPEGTRWPSPERVCLVFCSPFATFADGAQQTDSERPHVPAGAH